MPNTGSQQQNINEMHSISKVLIAIRQYDQSGKIASRIYPMRGLAKKSNTRPGGILVVFGLLIVPAASAAISYTGVLQRLLGAW